MKRLSIQVTAFTLTRLVLNTMVRMVYPFLGEFSRGLGVDPKALALAVTARSAAGVLAPFLASTADSRGRRIAMLSGLLLFSIGGMLVVARPVYLAFVLTLILTQLGKNTFDPAMQAYLGDRVLYQRRGRVLGITEFGWSMAFIAGVPVAGLLIARWGWVAPFPFLSALALLALLILSLLLPKDKNPAAGRPGFWKNFRTVFVYPPALAGLAIGLLISSANEVVNLMFGVWMEDSFGLKIAALGAASAVIGLSELGGESLVTLLTDRLGKERSVGAGIVLNSLAALAMPFLGRELLGALAGLFLFYLTFEFTIVSLIPLMSEVLPTARATLMSMDVAGHLLGRALGSLIAAPIYAFGFLFSGVAAAAFNLLALGALGLLILLSGERRKQVAGD